MSPASNQHAWLQGEVLALLRQYLPDGCVMPECSIQTPAGMKVANAVRDNLDFFDWYHLTNLYPEAHETGAEILLSPNSLAEMEEKEEIYFVPGAREFWNHA